MDSTPSGEETPKDYATRRIDMEKPDSAGEMVAPEPEKKPRTRKTAPLADETAAAAPAVTKPIADQPILPPPPPPPAPALPGDSPKNDNIWIAAIVCISVVVLACLCSCTIIAVSFLSNAPW
jgi:hypothetical protein